MNNIEFYTKGDVDEVIRRVGQVHTITMNCPLDDTGVAMLSTVMSDLLKKHKSGNNFNNVSTIDALNAFLYTTSLCETNEINYDKLAIIASSLKSFNKLKYINFNFLYDTCLLEKYENGLKMNDKSRTIKGIFQVNKLEMNLTDMFSQEIIDFLNIVMMMNDIIPNSYLERKFKIDFKFDEYVSFMNMFLGNNAPKLNRMDKHICDYFMTFPELINAQKPDIRIITNYADL